MNHNNTNPGEQWSGFMKIKTVLRLIPVSKSTWYTGIKSGKYPAQIHPSAGSSAWIASDIQALIQQIAKGKTK